MVNYFDLIFISNSVLVTVHRSLMKMNANKKSSLLRVSCFIIVIRSFIYRKANAVSKSITIKNVTLGEGVPVICVPIVSEDARGIVDEAKRLVDLGTKMIEWRADYMPQLQDTNVLRSVLLQLSEICKNSVLLVTIRTTTQGGRAKLDEKAYKKLLNVIATSHTADLLDLEYFFFKNEPTELIEELKKESIGIVTSHHNFQNTPSVTEMESLLVQMEEGGADIVKLSVMPRTKADVFRLMEAVSTFQANEPTPIIAMSMGRLGTISRVSGEFFGSCVTFGTQGVASAPGQIPVDELFNVMAVLHKHGSASEA